MTNNYLHSDKTSLIIKAFYKVYNTLGYGFLEKVYQNALLIELSNLGLKCSASFAIDVYYQIHKVGFYVADVIVDNCVVIEIKAAETLREEHEAQLINYLKATNIEVGMLLNFGKKQNFVERFFLKHTNLN